MSTTSNYVDLAQAVLANACIDIWKSLKSLAKNRNNEETTDLVLELMDWTESWNCQLWCYASEMDYQTFRKRFYQLFSIEVNDPIWRK